MKSVFWKYARMLLRYRGRLSLALVMAAVSAAGLGVGFLALVPVLQNILEPETARGLPELVADLDARINGVIPDDWIGTLPEGPYPAVLWTVVAIGILTVVGAAANFLHQFLSMSVSSLAVGDIRRRMFNHVLHFPLSTIVSGSASEVASRIINDTNKLNAGFQALTSRAVAQITKGAATLIVAIIVNWKLAIITLVVAPLLYTIIRKLGKRVRRASRGAMQSQAKLLTIVNEVLAGFRVAKVYTAERYEAGRFARDNRNVVREQLRVRTAKALASPLIETVAVFIIGVLAVIAAKAIIDGQLAKEEFFVVLGALGIAGQSLKPLTGVIQDIQVAEAAAQRIDKVLRSPAERDRDAKLPRLARHARSIEFEHVTFTYPNQEEPAVRDATLRIDHGRTVAFVGPNGSGKTTLLSLIPRLFEPDAGRIFIDGVDISTVSLRSLRRQIGVVTQETVLFRGTIADNIAYGRSGATREEIIDAARRAHAHEFVERQPGGYDTPVGDQGLTLSGGQRQRIAIARALLRDPAILIMDEATSMIDAESESSIAQTITEFSAGRTCLVVAHRLSTVLNADRIVVLDAGRVVDDGRHDELLDRCAVYRQIASHQLAPARAE